MIAIMPITSLPTTGQRNSALEFNQHLRVANNNCRTFLFHHFLLKRVTLFTYNSAIIIVFRLDNISRIIRRYRRGNKLVHLDGRYLVHEV